MENENNENLELDENENGADEVKVVEPKPKLTPEQIEGIKKRQFTKLAKELGIELPKTKTEISEKKEDENGFDYGELSYLEVKGVTEAEDQDWLREISTQSKLQLRELLAKDWVQKELKERNSVRKTDKGVPTGTKRSQGGIVTEDSPEYWVAQDKQPPETYPIAFRKKVLELREKKSVDDSKFSKSSIVAPGFPL